MRRTKWPEDKGEVEAKEKDIFSDWQRVVEWIQESNLRFDKVKDASDSYFKAQGRLVPPDFEDWIDFLIDTKRDLLEPITDKDFLKYHQWRVRILNAPPPKRERAYTTRAGGICLVMAKEAGLIEEWPWESKKMLEFVQNRFGINNSKRTCSHAGDWEYRLKEAELEYPEDYQIARKLFLGLFEPEV